MIIAPMCNLTKIFVPQLQTKYIKNPELIHKEESFSFIVTTSRRDYKFEYKIPKYETSPDLLNWFLGGENGLECQETLWTGLVKIDIDSETNARVLQAVTGIGKTKLDSDMEKVIAHKKELALKLAQERVMTQIRAINEALRKQYETNKTNGLAPYTPSATEYLCAYVLADEQQKDSEEKKMMTKKFADLMSSTFTI